MQSGGIKVWSVVMFCVMICRKRKRSRPLYSDN